MSQTRAPARGHRHIPEKPAIPTIWAASTAPGIRVVRMSTAGGSTHLRVIIHGDELARELARSVGQASGTRPRQRSTVLAFRKS